MSDYQHLASGKVRELYRIDDKHLLFVATDRISAFDYVLDSTIPDKGRVLTAMSVFFFNLVDAPIIWPGHLTTRGFPTRCSDARWWCGSWRWFR
ncbi:SAICAR synthetase family protein [Mycobacterium xenopi 4042]|uniref:phosphoribosylaminoimidazolesuccinocarboxamide synthase n=1 Tax=Mycobacterium xenopi 4042 TaxID=1299334 RepID=X7ZYD9_MYCXE|nr:SAICAR synthetase family protein [Mycobacterium xenopi 4042]